MTIEQFLQENLDHARTSSSFNWRPFILLIAGPFAFIYFLIKAYRDPKNALKSNLSATAIMVFIGFFGGISLMRFGWFSNLNSYLELLINAIVFGYFMTTIVAVVSFGAPDSRFREKMLRAYKQNDEEWFTENEVNKAAQILREFKPCSVSSAQDHFGNRIVDLLVIANAIYLNKRKLRRMVSIKAIEEDREADERDD